MFHRAHPNRLATTLALGTALVFGGHATAQSPAELAPADTAVYIHITDPADWFGDLTQGPLGEKWRDQIEAAEGSGDLLAALGMSLDEFMEAYFGGDVVVLSQIEGDDAPGIIFTQIARADRDHAIESLLLQRNGAIADNPVYIGPDGEGTFVMMDNWVAICELDDVQYLESILEQPANAPRLADTDFYARWTNELPAGRSMTALINESEASQHALGVVRNGAALDATYLGVSPDFDELMGMLGETSVAEFGPLPADTIAAASFNLVITEDNAADFEDFDALLRGKSFRDEVLPKLDAPTLLFLGSVDGGDMEPAVDVDVPVVGLAFKMNDASVAEDLKLMMDGVTLFANFAVAEFQAGLAPVRSESYEGSSFQVAEFGKPIAQGLGFPEVEPVQIVYGQVGDYYIVCTQEQFFKRCVDANAGGRPMRVDTEGQAHRLAKTPVLTITVQPDGFGELLLSWAKMLEQKGLPDALGAEAVSPVDLETLFDVIGVLRQYSLLKMQIWSGDDGLVIGRAQLTPPQ